MDSINEFRILQSAHSTWSIFARIQRTTLKDEDWDAQLIMPNLWVGSVHAAQNIQALTENKIMAILTCATGLVVPITATMTDEKNKSARHIIIKEGNWAVLPLRDKSDESFHGIHDALKFIHDKRKSGCGVLIHCVSGVSRSVTVTAAYLIYTGYCKTALEAIEMIHARRKCALPLPAFVLFLTQFVKDVHESKVLNV